MRHSQEGRNFAWFGINWRTIQIQVDGNGDISGMLANSTIGDGLAGGSNIQCANSTNQ
jgi:hypothetical protein